MWLDCSACGGRGANSIENPCLGCGGRGTVFKKCCGCRDCREKTSENQQCLVDDCPKDHSQVPAGNITKQFEKAGELNQ